MPDHRGLPDYTDVGLPGQVPMYSENVNLFGIRRPLFESSMKIGDYYNFEFT